MWDEPLSLAGRPFRSRLILEASEFSSPEVVRRCREASGAELVLVAVRQADLPAGILDLADPGRVSLLPGTAGCRSAEEAVRTAYLAREAGLGDLVRLEVVGDERTGAPDVPAVLEATRTLAGDGFCVVAASNDDPVAARRLAEAGAAAVTVPGSPPGSGLGVRNAHALRILLETVSLPVILSGGVGTASDAAIAMELGCHAVVVGAAVARSSDPEGMAEALKLAVEAGRFAHKAGRIPRKLHRSAWGSFEGLP